ncbi:hypothetical protein JXA84_06375 [candidate division WOR-3 bacterium]|nr:hypothetical protein [candidate division WOR-3 bacterium]
MLKYSIISFLFCSAIFSQDLNRVEISVVLSGELLIGLGYTRFLQDDISAQIDAYVIPAKGNPFAFDAGLIKNFGEVNFKPQIGAGFAAIIPLILKSGL